MCIRGLNFELMTNSRCITHSTSISTFNNICQIVLMQSTIDKIQSKLVQFKSMFFCFVQVQITFKKLVSSFGLMTNSRCITHSTSISTSNDMSQIVKIRSRIDKIQSELIQIKNTFFGFVQAQITS